MKEAKYIEREALIDALMMYTWRDEDDREIDDSDEKRIFIEEWFPSIPAADVVPASDFRDCRNELCLKCGAYTQKHLGACDGCRWRKADG